MIKYTVDIIYCLDATGSMDPIINTVKDNIERFYNDYQKALIKKGRTIDTLRIKIILFRDFYFDGDLALSISDFYQLPEQTEHLLFFLNRINAIGGGDEPESGLEALDIAISSDWNKIGDKKRQIIVLFTDASAHKLDEVEIFRPINYPNYISKNLDELTDKWESSLYMKENSKRLIIFAPDVYPWREISNDWTNTIYYCSIAGQGLNEVEYSEILNSIINSI